MTAAGDPAALGQLLRSRKLNVDLQRRDIGATLQLDLDLLARHLDVFLDQLEDVLLQQRQVVRARAVLPGAGRRLGGAG